MLAAWGSMVEGGRVLHLNGRTEGRCRDGNGVPRGHEEALVTRTGRPASSTRLRFVFAGGVIRKMTFIGRLRSSQ